MKMVTVSIAALALSCSLALAQTGVSPGGTLGGAPGTAGTTPGTVAPPGGSAIAPPGTPTPGSPVPGGSAGPVPGVPSTVPNTSPNPFTTGSGSGLGQVPQDLTRRYNRQDMTRPGAINPQDLTSGSQVAPGVPSIAVPEGR